MKRFTEYDPHRTFRQAVAFILLVCFIWLVAGLYSRAEAHDPNTREWESSPIGSMSGEYYTEVTTSDCIIVLSVMAGITIAWILSETFRDDYVQYSQVFRINERPKIINRKEICIRLPLYSFSL